MGRQPDASVVSPFRPHFGFPRGQPAAQLCGSFLLFSERVGLLAGIGFEVER